WVYGNHWPNYDLLYREYGRNPSTHLPYFAGEYDYEGENNAGRDAPTPLRNRKEDWWSALSGGTGQMFGNHYTWGFFPGWQSNIATTGASQFTRMARFLGALPWWSFVPDQSHSVLTAGYGTYASAGGQTITANDYATTVRSADGTTVVSYLPTNRTVSYA